MLRSQRGFCQQVAPNVFIRKITLWRKTSFASSLLVKKPFRWVLWFIHSNSGNMCISYLVALWQYTVVVQGELFPWSLLKGKYGEIKDLKKALLEFCRPIKVQSLSLQTLPPALSRPASTQDAETKDSEMVDGSIFPFYHNLIFFRPQPSFYSLVKILSYLEKSIIKWRYWSDRKSVV